MANRLTIPGFVNAHSHAFQRALRGRTEGGDFWAWREAMLALADEQSPERVRGVFEQVYREMLRAGYSAASPSSSSTSPTHEAAWTASVSPQQPTT